MIRTYWRRLIWLLSIVIFIFLGNRLLANQNLLLLPVIKYNASSHHQEHWRIATAYTAPPAMFTMQGQRPANVSVCSWNHGLPILLAYQWDTIMGTPVAGDNSPYRVLPFIIRGEEKLLPKVTLCTHATADQIYNIVEIIRRWEGPVSLAVFAPGLDAGLAINLLQRVCRCERHINKLSVHLIFPVTHRPIVSSNHHSKDDCSSTIKLDISRTERKRQSMIYPINVARNVARNLAKTSRVLVTDIELLPSEKLASSFMKMIHARPPHVGLVFVVPVFEISENQQIPKSKRELVSAIKNGLAVYFHKYICTHCQRFPGITRWMLKPDPGQVRPLIITRREYPYHRWEPLYIGTQQDPFYNEDMSWEGQQDKMAQMLEMCLMNYRFIVLDGAFLVHTPGIKRKILKTYLLNNSIDLTQEKRNAHLYQIATQQLLKQYPINSKCRQ